MNAARRWGRTADSGGARLLLWQGAGAPLHFRTSRGRLAGKPAPSFTEPLAGYPYRGRWLLFIYFPIQNYCRRTRAGRVGGLGDRRRGFTRQPASPPALLV